MFTPRVLDRQSTFESLGLVAVTSGPSRSRTHLAAEKGSVPLTLNPEGNSNVDNGRDNEV